MLYIYDAMFSTKKECSLKYVSKLFKISHNELNVNLENGKCLRTGRWFLIDDSTKLKTIREFHSQIKLECEAWKAIKETNGEYFISSYGRVKDKNGKFYLPYQRNLKNGKKSVRYVKLKVNGTTKEFAVSRLVAYYFIVASNKLSFDDFKAYRVCHKNKFSHDDYFNNLKIIKVS